MKLKIKKDLLLDGLTKVSKAISTKNLVPVLAVIIITVETVEKFIFSLKIH